MRKYRSHKVPGNATWYEINQIVIPTCLRNNIISIAHDLGHLGVRKTEVKILKGF